MRSSARGRARWVLALGSMVLSFFAGSCGRVHVGSHDYQLPGGKVIVETWDDPFDSLKSRRLFWQEEGSEDREEIAEVWVQWDERMDMLGGPQLVARDPLTLVWAPHCFQRWKQDDWRECSDNVRQRHHLGTR